MSVVSVSDIWQELKKSRIGIAGLSILGVLIIISIIAIVSIPLDTFKQWHNQAYWIEYPRAAMPAWLNIFSEKKLPEHLILKPTIEENENSIRSIVHRFTFDYNADLFPTDFLLKYDVRYTSSPLLQLSITRPDGLEMELARLTLPSQNNDTLSGTLFSTDNIIKKSITNYRDNFNFDSDEPTRIIFADKDGNILKGRYEVKMTIFLFDENDEVIDSKFILGGKVYGLFGTDELRRDLTIGIVWGAPLALFIGIAVSVLAVIIGLIYGVIAGYKGGNTDEMLMRANDIVYALPALPLLILLAVFVGKSIFLMVGYLIIFSWVGIAKVSRSMALQIKNMQYVEAAELIGQSSIKIMFKHIIPQLLPYTFASIAVSVPGAIITEAGLSFLGLGDPTLPTWGQILHDANVYGASARGLWWWIIPPGAMIALTGLAFVLIGNALDAIVNPRMRKL
ncbi:MAG: ABC transporter permease [Candidatus Nitrosothermus koennekii]|nr:MAG: ABC transporter permease [Candidatus Nitrosothermus koennekii]